jgi:hypothetical protein
MKSEKKKNSAISGEQDLDEDRQVVDSRIAFLRRPFCIKYYEKEGKQKRIVQVTELPALNGAAWQTCCSAPLFFFSVCMCV